MSTHAWQKSSYCGQSESCMHVAAGEGTVMLTESADPSQVILATTPGTFAGLIRTLKARPNQG
jgi:uncharacterized protein DUF397